MTHQPAKKIKEVTIEQHIEVLEEMKATNATKGALFDYLDQNTLWGNKTTLDVEEFSFDLIIADLRSRIYVKTCEY